MLRASALRAIARMSAALLFALFVAGCNQRAANSTANASASASGAVTSDTAWRSQGTHTEGPWSVETFAGPRPTLRRLEYRDWDGRLVRRITQARPQGKEWEAHGPATLWLDDGTRIEGQYWHGNEDGQWVTFDGQGHKILEQRYKFGVLDREVYHYADGRKRVEVDLDGRGRPKKQVKYDEHGVAVGTGATGSLAPSSNEQ